MFSENDYGIIHLIGDDSKVDTPDPIPNSEVKHFNADDSYAKIGSCQFFLFVKILLEFYSVYDIIHLHGDIGEVVNTVDCGSIMRGFESLISPQM